MNNETRSNLNIFLTIILVFLYCTIITSVIDYFIANWDFKKRVAYCVPIGLGTLFLLAFLAGATYNHLEKKYNRENWEKYNGN